MLSSIDCSRVGEVYSKSYHESILLQELKPLTQNVCCSRLLSLNSWPYRFIAQVGFKLVVAKKLKTHTHLLPIPHAYHLQFKTHFLTFKTHFCTFKTHLRIFKTHFQELMQGGGKPWDSPSPPLSPKQSWKKKSVWMYRLCQFPSSGLLFYSHTKSSCSRKKILHACTGTKSQSNHCYILNGYNFVPHNMYANTTLTGCPLQMSSSFM